MSNCPDGFLPMAGLVAFLQHAWADGARPEWLVKTGLPVEYDGRLESGPMLQAAILSFLGPLLVSGKLRTAGIDQERGQIVWIPMETWRVMVNATRGGSQRSSVLQMALTGEEVGTLGMIGPRRRCLPLLRLSDMCGIAGVTETPMPMSVEPLDITEPPATPKPTPMAEEPRRNPGGRQAKYDWDSFWIEVAWYAAENDLDGEHRTELQQRMEQWTGQKWRDPPDGATIRRKLAALYARATAPN